MTMVFISAIKSQCLLNSFYENGVTPNMSILRKHMTLNIESIRRHSQVKGMTYNFIIKIVIQIFLFCLFLVIFGVPSLKRYYAKDVLTNTEEKDLKNLKIPAVTVCPR